MGKRKSPATVVVWDTNIIIDLLQQTPKRIDDILPFMEDAEAGRLAIVVTEVTYIETCRVRQRSGNPQIPVDLHELVDEFFAQPYVHRRAVDRPLAEAAGQIARAHNLKRAADALCVAIAMRENISTVHTHDGHAESDVPKGLHKLNGLVGTPPITIEAPNHGRGTLHDPALRD